MDQEWKKNSYTPEGKKRCRRIKHTMRKLETKISGHYTLEKPVLRNGRFDNETVVFF